MLVPADDETGLVGLGVECKGAVRTPSLDACMKERNGLSSAVRDVHLPLALIDPATIRIEIGTNQDDADIGRIGFRCDFDPHCGVAQPPSYWGDTSALLCRSTATCRRMAADLAVLVAHARAKDAELRPAILKELEGLDCECEDDGIAFEEAARRVGLMRRLVQGGVYAAPRVGGENGVLAPIWYEITGEETYDWHLRYVEAGCLSTEHNVRDLIEACRSGAAKLERIVARVALYDLATDQVSWLDGASLDSAGQGVLMVVPCFDGEQCVASETTDETSNAVLVPCRDRAACDQFLRHLDFLTEEAFWLAF
jgi:hypothetical protein